MCKEKSYMCLYGFVYIWFDRKRKMYYIGSHWGTEDDGYICSSKWMRDAYRKRPEDFRRRVLLKVGTNRRELLIEEGRLLCMIKEDEPGRKYYNLKRNAFENAWFADGDRKLSVGQKIGQSNSISLKNRSMSTEVKKKISESLKGKKRGPQSEEHKRKLSEARRGSKRKPYKRWSEESRTKRSLAMIGNKRRLGTGKRV